MVMKKRIDIMLDPEIIKKLDNLAKKEHRSRSNMISKLIIDR